MEEKKSNHLECTVTEEGAIKFLLVFEGNEDIMPSTFDEDDEYFEVECSRQYPIVKVDKKKLKENFKVLVDLIEGLSNSDERFRLFYSLVRHAKFNEEMEIPVLQIEALTEDIIKILNATDNPEEKFYNFMDFMNLVEETELLNKFASQIEAVIRDIIKDLKDIKITVDKALKFRSFLIGLKEAEIMFKFIPQIKALVEGLIK